MKLKITSLLFVGILISSAAFAQPENVARLGLFNFALGNVSLSYERVLGEKASAGLYLGYVYGGPGAGSAQAFDNSLPAEYDVNPFKGIVLHPEFRLYSAKNGAPKGFYFAPYFRFVNTKSSSTYTWTPPDPTGTGLVIPPSVFNADILYRHMSLGFQLGHQFLINDMVAIDFFWFGPRLIGQNTYGCLLYTSPSPRDA